MGRLSDYQRIVNDVTAKIEAGLLKPGDTLPSIREMAKQYDTSLTTVKTALLALGRDGLTEGHQGRATFVLDPKRRRGPDAEPKPTSGPHR